MLPSNSLRFRVALVFAVFGAMLSILLAAGLYVTAQQLGHRLMDEALQAELDDSVERQVRDAVFVPPNTVSIKGYVLSPSSPGKDIPDGIKALSPGKYNKTIQDTDYRILVEDRNSARYFMLFDTNNQHMREEKFFHSLIFFALLMTGCSAGAGFWLAVSVISPVSQLATLVGQAEPGDASLPPVKLERNDEVGELARAFDRYMRRMREFVERENYFAADVSHELRTPLAIIGGTVEVLEQDATLTQKQRERIERIKRAMQDMVDLTSALLLLAREYRPSAEAGPCDVDEVIRTCADKHGYLIAGRPISLELDLAGSPRLNVERPLLEVVIGNLLRNALFNTRSGTILIGLEEDRLIVKDSGLGMSQEVLAHAFEQHFKGVSSAGAGVGLSLVKRICDRYGWQIHIESEQEKGTTVAVHFGTLRK